MITPIDMSLIFIRNEFRKEIKSGKLNHDYSSKMYCSILIQLQNFDIYLKRRFFNNIENPSRHEFSLYIDFFIESSVSELFEEFNSIYSTSELFWIQLTLDNMRPYMELFKKDSSKQKLMPLYSLPNKGQYRL